MTRRAALAIVMIVAAASASVAAGVAMPGVADGRRAHVNWVLKCQGCHQPNADGHPVNAPPLAGQVARVLALPGGREYLGRVPGVATSALPDAELAELLNWTLLRFDPGHVPANFRPYSANEIARLRRRPLRVEAAATRARLVAGLPATPGGAQRGINAEGGL